MNTKPRVAAYITAYEDQLALEACVLAICKQSFPVQKIFVIDNSQIQLKLTSQIVDLEAIVFEHHPENVGVSGGLKMGFQWAIENGYDFLWTFDQDSEPEIDCLEKLLNCHEELTDAGRSIGLIAPLPIEVGTNLELNGLLFKGYRFKPVKPPQALRRFYECDVVITSGSLVLLKAISLAPRAKDDLFIDAVDWMYCMNIREQGYEILVLREAILKHHFGGNQKIKTRLAGKALTTRLYSPLRYYYICRNHTFIEIHYAKLRNQIYRAIIYRIFMILKTLTKIYIYDRSYIFLKTKACLYGTCDGFRGKLGKTWQSNR